TLYIDPATVFSVNYSADMLFMVVIGGIGTMEGPIIGAVIFFAVQERFSSFGAWYLVAIGAVAIVVVLGAPGGLWGLAGRRGWSGTGSGVSPHPGHPAPLVRPPGVMAMADRRYTVSRAVLEAMREAGVSYLFANLGSDHTGIVEAYAQARSDGGADALPELVLCPHEFVALSAAQGYAQVSGEAQAVLVHVDCGTQNLGGALPNLSRAARPA